MSYSLNRSINRSRRIDSETSNSPRNNMNVPPKETVFEFFRKKSRRDLDRSFSSAKQSRRHKETVSPQVQLLKDLNTSPSPTKQPQKSRLSPNKKTCSPNETAQNPLKISDLRYNSNRDDFSFTSDSKRERNNAETPLFIKLIKAGHNTNISFNNNKDKPRVPIAPTNVKRRLSTSLNPHNYSHVQERVNPFDDERSLEEMINQGHRHSFRDNNNSTIQNSTIHYSPLRNSISRNNGSPLQRSHRSLKSHRSQRDQISPLRESRSPPRRSQATPQKSVGSPLSKRLASPLRASVQSPARKQSPLRKSISSPARDVKNTTQEIKFFKGHNKAGAVNGSSLTACIQEYEHKYDELSDLLQRQVLQNNRIFQLLSDPRYSRDYGLNEIKTLVEDLGLTLVAASRFMNEGLFDTKECLALFAKAEQRHKQEINELTEALDNQRSAVRTEKNEHHEKLEDLLTYIENLKRAPKVDSEEEARRRQKERALIEKREVEIAKLKEHVRQLTQENKHYENQVRNLAQENQDLGVQNAYLKESQEVLRKEAEVLRNHFEENSRAQSNMRKERKASKERRESKEGREGQEKRVGGIREVIEGKRSNSKGRQTSPLKSMRSPSLRSASPTKRLAGLEEGNGQLKKELDLMSHRMEILAKENEELARKLTDKILIERENKALMYKTQELADGLKSKAREYDNLMRAVKDTKDKLVNTGGHTILSSTLKHYGLEDRPLGKLTHW